MRTGSGWTEHKPQAEVLAVLKHAKKGTKEAAFATECGANSRPTHWITLDVLEATPTDPHMAVLKTRAATLASKLSEVDRAANAAAVEVVRW